MTLAMTSNLRRPGLRRPGVLLATLAAWLLLGVFGLQPAQATRIKEVASIQGVRSNALTGYGLVVGLDGTGDQTTQTPFTTQSLYAPTSLPYNSGQPAAELKQPQQLLKCRSDPSLSRSRGWGLRPVSRGGGEF